MTIAKKLQDLGIVEAGTQEMEPRLILSVEGLEKKGKTHLALTAPKPLVLFNLDIGLEGVVRKFSDQEIYQFDFKPYNDQQTATTAWNSFRRVYRAVLEDRTVKTLVVDTATEAWEVIRLARFGKLNQVMPHQYGPVNAEFRELLRAAYSTNKNVVFLHKMKPQYINDKRTAKYERAGFSDMGFLVQVSVRMERDISDPDEPGDFECHIIECRQNPEIAGTVLEGPMCSFPWLGVMVYPETDAEDWGG